jgi:hypothetical protein
VQKLNRNSIFIFVNGRLIRDRLVQHAITEAYRNIMPPSVFPVVLLFLEMPHAEVDVNVHPSKTEVRFRQQSFVHDFVRDSIRAVLMSARPAPEFVRAISAEPSAAQALSPRISQATGAPGENADSAAAGSEFSVFSLIPQPLPPMTQSFQFSGEAILVEANAAVPVARFGPQTFGTEVEPVVGDARVPSALHQVDGARRARRRLARDALGLALRGDAGVGGAGHEEHGQLQLGPRALGVGPAGGRPGAAGHREPGQRDR